VGDLKQRAERCAEALFVNGAGDRAHRLVLTALDGRDLGGWSERAMADRIERVLSDICTWHEDADGVWASSCDRRFVFGADGPVENLFRHCPHCGLPLTAVPYVEVICLTSAKFEHASNSG